MEMPLARDRGFKRMERRGKSAFFALLFGLIFLNCLIVVGYLYWLRKSPSLSNALLFAILGLAGCLGLGWFAYSRFIIFFDEELARVKFRREFMRVFFLLAGLMLCAITIWLIMFLGWPERLYKVQ